MKKLLFISTCLLMASISHGKIWRVNNTGAPADFTTAQAAHDGAAAGDTLHFEASAASYGSLSVTKKIIIIGNGYYLGTLISNANPDLQARPVPSTLSTVSFIVGSNGSVMEGMTVSSTVTVISGAANILIRRNNLIGSISLGTCSNVQI